MLHFIKSLFHKAGIQQQLPQGEYNQRVEDTPNNNHQQGLPIGSAFSLQ